MSVMDDVIAWLKKERATLVTRIEKIEAGIMTTGEKRPGVVGDVDTTAKTLHEAKRKIPELDALLARCVAKPDE